MAPSIICLVFSLFVITETTDISGSVPNMTVDDVTMSPDGFYYMLVGRTVNLTCWVTSSTSNSSSLVIALNDSLRDDVITPDDATAQVTVTNMAAGTFFYRCCVSSCPAMSELNPSDPNISAVTLKYGDPPPLVSNVTCASLDFINLDCSLTISGAGQDVAWILSYCIKDYIPTDDPLACPGDITSRTKCDPSPQWPPPGKGVMLFHCAEEVLEYQVYRIYVDGDSHFGRTSYLTEVYTGPSIVQYSAVRGLRVGPNVTSTSITLLWDNPVRIFGAQPMYSVVVTQSEMGYHEDFESKVSSYKVPSLRPATTYLAELRAKPRSSPYWNKPTYINITTLDAAPGVPPGLKPGMYTRWEDGVHVMVFWQAVPRALRNGKITHHRVCLDLPNNVSLFCNTLIPGDQFHYLLVLPEGAGNCTVTVQAGTRAALSKKSSLRIPNIGQAPQRPLYVTVEQQDDSSYNVSWVLANHNVRLDHVYVTWCQAFRTSEEVTCINDVHSVEIDGSATSYTVTLAMDPGLRKGAWFGVATSADDVSDGTTWNQCIFVKYGAMGSPPAMNVLSNERTAWLPLGFSYCDVSLNKGRPYVYEVSYQSTNTTSCSDVNCTDGSVIQEPAQFDTTVVFLTGLNRPAMYCVCLRVRSTLRVGPYSHPPKLLDLSVLTDDPKPVNLAAIVGVTSGLVTMVIVAVFVVYHRRRLNPLKKIQIDLGMFRDMEHGDSGDKNRLSSENPAFLNIHADPTPVSSSTAHEDDVTRMESNQSKDDGHAELRVLQTEQPLRPADTDSGNASDAAMVAVSAGPAGGVEGPEYAPGNIQDKATSEPGSYPSSGYKSTLNRSKASRSSTGGSVTLAQVPGHLSGHQDLGAPSKPDETTPSLLPSNKQSRTASRVESQHEILAEVDQGGYVVYPGQVAAGVRNVEQRKKDEERLTDDLEYVRCNVSTDVPNILTDDFEYVRCNVSMDVPNASTDDLEYVRCNVSTDIPNASTDDLEYVRCNVSTDVPNILTDNFEYVRCNVSADVPNASTEDLEYVRCNVSTDVPNILTDNFEYVRCSAHSSIVGHVQPEST
ncbi:uncharacterized protein LOC124272098 isoform X2 [Haliotis rubra]|uniref:uncharacterized protein LOC124272098 isoform X2 n=1 Tax=Haliotis rubra TaxID=36100 RepID=UPI001EE55B12|nr:uncharacterized protein LOC124272098 isoform X2 [Haliotis rubra]